MKVYEMNKLGADKIAALCRRPAVDLSGVLDRVRPIIEDVKRNGAVAVRKYTEKFDGVVVARPMVTPREVSAACGRVPVGVRAVFRQAAKNIEKFHEAQVKAEQKIETMPGVVCFRENRAIERVGLYVPAGSAPLPSTVLMLGIPAKVAGCKEVVMCAPPGPDGKIPDIILFAARLAGISKIFKAGGAQAIAAMAYGAGSIPKADKIFGPGNQYVTAAKMLVSIDPDGAAIDLPAGPSEVLVIADDQARADFVAADLLSQAEHGPDSQVVLVCTSAQKIEAVSEEIKKQIEKLPRREIAIQSLAKSFALKVPNISKAIEFSNLYAPEHLILNVATPQKFTKKITNAGSVFLGALTPESAGDYASGTNHTLPTSGYAKAYSGLSVESFSKKITFQKLNSRGLKNLTPIVSTMAETETLEAHKQAIIIRNK